MKKKFIALMVIMTMVLAIPAYAASARTIDVISDITFNGTTATCNVQIAGDRTTDRIAATVELWRGTTLIDDWSSSGSGILSINETAAVERNKTYKLTVKYSINGVTQNPVSIFRTNN